MNIRIITIIIAPFLFLDGTWSFSHEFKNAACPNKCSYDPDEAMTIKCQDKGDNTTTIKYEVDEGTGDNATTFRYEGQMKPVEVPRKIKHLIFEGCTNDNLPPVSNLSSVRSATFIGTDKKKYLVNPLKVFRSLEHIVCLKLHGSRIEFKESNVSAFQPLKNLEYLELDETIFHRRSDYIFHLSVFQEEYKLRSIVLSYYIYYTDIKIVNLRDVFWPFRKSKLSCFTIQNETQLTYDVADVLNTSLIDMYQHFEIIRFRDIYDLTFVNTGNDGMIYFNWGKLLKNVKTLETSNALEIRLICSDRTSKLTKQYINNNNFTYIDRCTGESSVSLFPIMTSIHVENLIFHHTTVYSSCRESDKTKCFFLFENKLKRLDFSYLTQKNTNVFNCIINGLDHLLYLNMEGNLVSDIPDLYFHFFPKLETLLLGGNKLGNILEMDRHGILFLKLNRLKYLDLSSNNIKGLPFGVFKGLTQLEILNLTDNSLLQFEVDLWPMVKLDLLVLKENTLADISPNTTYLLDKTVQRNNKTFKIDLSNNRLTCNCGDMIFIKWLQTTNVTLIHGDSYSCTNVYGHKGPLKDIDLDSLQSFCNPLTKGQIAGIVITITLINMSIIFGIVLYKKRHQWRYKLFRMYYYRNKTNHKLLYKYDGYVCYSSEDYEWVQDKLLSNLENKHGLKLCLDKRDFVAGNYITNNILESIEGSRKTILIISPKFVQSKWCEYELYMANQKFLDDGYDVIVPVLYKPLEGNTGNNLLKTIIRMKTYIAWDDKDPEKFWKQLKEAILYE